MLENPQTGNHLVNGSCNEINNYFRNNRVIVVGSHPSVLQHKVGHLIDDFDVIVRFNLATCEGHEECLGSRTDVRFLNRCGIHLDNVKMTEFRKSLRDQKIIQVECTGKLNLHESNEVWNLDFNPRCLVDIKCGRIGIYCLIWLICIGVKPTIHGFELDRDKAIDMSNYTGINEGQQSDHDPQVEVDYLNRFVESGAIKILDTGNV